MAAIFKLISNFLQIIFEAIISYRNFLVPPKVETMNIYKFTAHDCDIDQTNALNVERLSKFRELRKGWIDYLINEKRSIRNDYSALLHNFSLFRSIQFLRGNRGEIPDTSRFLMNYFITSYCDLQSLRVRRLTAGRTEDDDKRISKINDPKKKLEEIHNTNKFRSETSLQALMDDIADNIGVFTREMYVCCDGLPYDYEKVKEETREEREQAILSESGFALPIEGPKGWGRSEILHKRFDLLSGIEPTKRKRSDVLSIKTINKLKKILNDRCVKIRKYANKNIAHVEPDTKKREKAIPPTYAELHDAIQTIYQVMNFVSFYVLNDSFLSNNVMYADNFAEDIVKPIIPDSEASQGEAALQAYHDEIAMWNTSLENLLS